MKQFYTLETAISVLFLHHDDNRSDYATAGLHEDIEPHHIFKDTWLRSKVHVDTLYKEEDEDIPESGKRYINYIYLINLNTVVKRHNSLIVY